MCGSQGVGGVLFVTNAPFESDIGMDYLVNPLAGLRGSCA